MRGKVSVHHVNREFAVLKSLLSYSDLAPIVPAATFFLLLFACLEALSIVLEVASEELLEEY